MKVIIPGGCGYIGAVLAPWLLERGHRVTVFDTQWLGDGGLVDSKRLKVIKGDVRDVNAIRAAMVGQDAVIWLASVSSDQMCQRDPQLAEDVNKNCILQGVIAAKDAGARRFIYASSVAAYGSSDTDATEDRELKPTTLYGKAKAVAEKLVLGRAAPDFHVTITRSASVCGYSPRMRFDITVNKMLHDAVLNGRVVVNGGRQKRCHAHIHDVCDFYALLLDMAPEHVAGQAFNVVAENATVMESAEMVIRAISPTVRRARNMMAFIEVRDATDDRSYTVDGRKAREVLNFVPRRSISSAVQGMKDHFDSGTWADTSHERYWNLLSA